jgi:hypothetical protein
MLFANIGNGLLWFAYGLATRDWFLIMPNGIGATFSFLSLGISFMFPTTERNERLKHGTVSDTQQQQEQQGQVDSFTGRAGGRRVGDCASTHQLSGRNAGYGPVAWLLGVTRASSNPRTAASDTSPMAAEEAIQGSGMVLELCHSGSAAAAEQQLLHMQGCVTGSREGGHSQDVDGKVSSMV